MKQTRPLWQSPWQYRESALFVAGVVAVGFALQAVTGHFNFFLLHYPTNMVIALVLAASLVVSYFFRKTALFQWLSSLPFCVSIIMGFLVFSLIMGLTPQLARPEGHTHGLVSILGFTRVTSSWPFILLYALLLVSLGLVIIRRIGPLRKTDLAFYCNHLGLWVLLLAAGLGAADMQRFIMHVREGEVEWRVYAAENEVLDLPIAIKLKDFMMEEYPPKLLIIDRENGKPQPEGAPAALQIDEKRPNGELGGWKVSVEEYIHEAVRFGEGYRRSPMPASTPAVRVTARNAASGELKTGWISSGGNIPGFFSALPLTDNLTLVMGPAEPKRFVSDITVITEDGKKADALLEVNKPLTVGPWMIYQHSYDAQAGKMSTYSSMELVKDPWLRPALFGIILMMVGAVCMVLQGTGKGRAKNELE